jgi:hypothetical protein
VLITGAGPADTVTDDPGKLAATEIHIGLALASGEAKNENELTSQR